MGSHAVGHSFRTAADRLPSYRPSARGHHLLNKRPVPGSLKAELSDRKWVRAANLLARTRSDAARIRSPFRAARNKVSLGSTQFNAEIHRGEFSFRLVRWKLCGLCSSSPSR